MRHARGTVPLTVAIAAALACTPATLRLPDRPDLPVVVAPPTAPTPEPAAARYTSPAPTVDSFAPRKVNIAGAPLAMTPAVGGSDPLELRAGLVKALVKAGLRVRDFDSAGRVLAAYRRSGPGTSTDLYGAYLDVIRAAPATVGGFVLWPEVLAYKERRVQAGGEPTLPPEAVAAWRTEVSGYEAARTSRQEAVTADLNRYRKEFDAALARYMSERAWFQHLFDANDDPPERRTFQQVVEETTEALERLERARPVDLDETLASAARAPETLEVASGRVRLLLCDARTGEIVAVHELNAEAASRVELSKSLVDLAVKALGVKR